MSKQLQDQIVEHVKSSEYQPLKPHKLAHEMNLADDQAYPSFREALRELMHAGRVVLGARGAVIMPSQRSSKNEFTGAYRHNKRGFGFVVPTDPGSHEDLYIPQGENNGAMNGDVVRAIITSRGHRDGRAMFTGRITEIVQRKSKRFAGSLAKVAGEWVVLPDGNTFTEPILTPDAASRHIRVGTKVVVEITAYPEGSAQRAQGVITEVLGEAGEKDVDLKSVIVHANLPGEFPEEVKDQARQSVDSFNVDAQRQSRFDLTDEVICTIDPDDAKDYDDAISLRKLDDGEWELGVHIADVSFFVPEDTPLDLEARERGNSTYFPGHVIPMLPEILSNGVCSLQEAVPRLCKSAFITYDEDARPIRAKFANTIIKSRKRLRYREAQAILDNEKEIPHPDGPKKVSDYPAEVVSLLRDMDDLAHRLQKRRRQQGQLVLDLPEVQLVLNEDGKVVDAVPEDTSFTHTLIEMFMVEANEAVARLFNSLDVPFIRRVHPEPDLDDSSRLRHFTEVTGHALPKTVDRKAMQTLLDKIKGLPEAFALNLAVLRSLTRAEYSPQVLGHYALASEHYTHFTSPIRRYADLMIHRLLDKYFEARGDASGKRTKGGRKSKVVMDDVPSNDDLVQLGRHLSFTERRSEDAERELRRVKILELLAGHIGEEFTGVITGITNFGIFVQLNQWLADGLIRYEDLLDDWWDVDERSGLVRGQRTGQKIGIGDVAKVVIVKVNVPRRELDLAIREVTHRARPGQPGDQQQPSHGKSKKPFKGKKPGGKQPQRGGGPARGGNSRGGGPKGGGKGRRGRGRR